MVDGYSGKWKTDSASSEKIFQTGYLKLNKGFATWFSTFCANFCVQILKNHENKAKRTLPCFHVPYMLYFKWNVSFTKVLRMCSLTQVTILCSLWDCKNYIKMGKTQKRVVWEAKHKPHMFGIIIQSCLSNMWCIARLGTICAI